MALAPSTAIQLKRSFTANGILFGNATGALKVTAAGTSGQVLKAGTNGTPEFGGIDGGTY